MSAVAGNGAGSTREVAYYKGCLASLSAKELDRLPLRGSLERKRK